MKNITILAVLAVSVSACSSMQATDSKQTKLGLANPASQYCVDQGGKLEIVKEANGEVGYCHLANGEKVEEWALFRQSQAQCVAEEATKLVGQTGLTDEQIKQTTKAQVIRRVGPNQPVTMDYRVDRVTVTIEPITKIITQANCG
ncbi:DUF333 domain-containing protein [uncultured Acinetobacter sp.]|uniref:putative hemolysin n=1 Tax=uncultured Acinetobacter sp. TaxID=165433 RepID=UPI0025CCF683|nr:DUF333 domain-containing protein [uncultured Acinetobacter sp.]